MHSEGNCHGKHLLSPAQSTKSCLTIPFTDRIRRFMVLCRLVESGEGDRWEFSCHFLFAPKKKIVKTNTND